MYKFYGNLIDFSVCNIMFFLNVDIEFMYFIYILEYMFVNVLYNLLCKKGLFCNLFIFMMNIVFF